MELTVTGSTSFTAAKFVRLRIFGKSALTSIRIGLSALKRNALLIRMLTLR